MDQKKASLPTPMAMQTRRHVYRSRLSHLDDKRKSRLNRKGFGTLEVVIIIAVLLSIALIFRASLTQYAENMIQAVLGDQSVIDDLADDNATTN